MKARLALFELSLVMTFAPMALAQDPASSIIPLKEAKLNIEHNFTDKDTGFQGAVDSEGWKQLTFLGPNGVVLDFAAKGPLRNLGITELFFETVEPENAEVPISTLLSRMPAGFYNIYGPAGGPDNGKVTYGRARLTHTIPKGPELLAPAEGSTVPVADLTIDWSPVTETIDNKPVNIIAYQLIVEKVIPPHRHMIGKRNSLSMYVGPTVTKMTVPGEFLEPGTEYDWEVLAIEQSGNQTLSSASFSTK